MTSEELERFPEILRRMVAESPDFEAGVWLAHEILEKILDGDPFTDRFTKADILEIRRFLKRFV